MGVGRKGIGYSQSFACAGTRTIYPPATYVARVGYSEVVNTDLASFLPPFFASRMPASNGQQLCPGCKTLVSRSFFILHLERSSNRCCSQHLQSLRLQSHQLLDVDSDSERESLSGNNMDEDLNPQEQLTVDASGDIFGDYDDYANEFAHLEEEEPATGEYHLNLSICVICSMWSCRT